MIGEVSSESLWLPLIVQATLCMAAGLAASCLLRNSAAKAHQVLLTALVASVLTPGAYVFVRHFQFGVLASEPISIVRQITEPVGSFDPSVMDESAVKAEYGTPLLDISESIATVPTYIPAPTAPLAWGRVCLGGWIALSTVLLGRLVLQFALALRLLTTARPLESERLHRAVQSARDRMEMVGPVRIQCSEKIRSPIIWCWTRRPVLLVPAGAEHHQNNADWVSVFCHELAHLRRRDHISGLIAETMTALLPWHPLLWWAAARLSRLSEQACDDWVLASGQNGTDYAETLLGLAVQRQMAFVPTIIGKEKTMSTRIHRIIKDRCGDPRIGAKWAAGVTILAMLVVVSVGFAQRRPVEREKQEIEITAEQPAPPERREAMPGWQREVFERKLDELAGQINEKEAMLHRAGDMPPEERRMQEFDLDLLRLMMAQIERRFQNPERPESRRSPETEIRQELEDGQLTILGQELERPSQESKVRSQRRVVAGDPYGSMYGDAYGGGRRERIEDPRDATRRRTPDGDRRKTQTRVYALQYGNPERIQAILQALVEPPETVTRFANGTKVAVNATVENHLKIERVIRELDVPPDEFRSVQRQISRTPTETQPKSELEAQVEDLRHQMNDLREQLRQMHKLQEQTGAREQTDRAERRQDNVQEDRSEL